MLKTESLDCHYVCSFEAKVAVGLCHMGLGLDTAHGCWFSGLLRQGCHEDSRR